MERVFHTLVIPDIPVEGLPRVQAADIIPFFGRDFFFRLASRGNFDDHLQANPTPLEIIHESFLEHLVTPGLDPAVTFIHFRHVRDGAGTVAGSLDFFPERLLVVFHGQDIVRFLLDDFLTYGGLGAHRVNGYNGTFYIEQIQQFRNGRDLVAFSIRFPLSQAEVILHAPGMDKVDGRLAVEGIFRAPDALAVNGDDLLQVAIPLHLIAPLYEQAFKMAGVDHAEDPVDRVVRGNAIGKLQELL